MGLKRLERTLSDLCLPGNDTDWREGIAEDTRSDHQSHLTPPQASAVGSALFAIAPRMDWKGYRG